MTKIFRSSSLVTTRSFAIERSSAEARRACELILIFRNGIASTFLPRITDHQGSYCGRMVWIGDDGRMRANVMIRTAAVSRDASENRVLDYSAGAGIVADSEPADEWAETLAKSRILGAFL